MGLNLKKLEAHLQTNKQKYFDERTPFKMLIYRPASNTFSDRTCMVMHALFSDFHFMLY